MEIWEISAICLSIGCPAALGKMAAKAVEWVFCLQNNKSLFNDKSNFLKTNL